MEKIYKTINIDNSRSHRNGLLPFVRFNGNSATIETVDATTKNGNYGQYVCDFAFYDYDSSTLKATNERRLKYLDVLSKYNFIQEQLRNAVYVKKYTFSKNEIVFQDCEKTDTKSASIIEKRWRTEFEEINKLGRYQYKPVDINRFKKEDNYYLLIDGEDIDSEYCVLVPNYEKIIEYNDFWNDWWCWLTFDKNEIKKFKEENKPCIIENALEKIFWKYSDTYVKEFKFCSDLEHYVLGIIEVIDNSNIISGSKVPNYLYYTNYFDFKDWFDNHKKGDKEWEERGGDVFYKFLKDNLKRIKWVSKNKFLENDTIEFKFVAPEVDVYTILNNDMEFESLFTPYEYSIYDDIKEPILTQYEVPLSGYGSALTPTFITDKYYQKFYNEKINAYEYRELDKEAVQNAINVGFKFEKLNAVPSAIATSPDYVHIHIDCKVESKLETLIHPKAMHVTNDIYGIFEEFSDEIGIGQMYECTLASGWSVSGQVEYFSAFTHTFNKTSYSIDKEIPPSTSAYQIVYPHIMQVSSDTKTHIVKDVVYTSAYTKNLYYWWECEPLSGSTSGLTCADGENVLSGELKYKNVTIVSCINSLVGECNVGDVFYVYARYNNGRTNPTREPIDILSGGTIVPLSIPYKTDIKLNKYTIDDILIYDKVSVITPSDNFITINYFIGAIEGNEEKSGIHYEDVIPYRSNNVKIVPIDGVFLAELYYNEILKNEAMEDVYSNEYRLHRKALRSTLKGMEVASIWTEDLATNTMLFTKEGMEGLQEEPKYNINLTYNRGNAAAWENHFKLSECNTLEDLENYGNNFFNL